MTYDAPMRRYDGSRGWIRIFGEPVYEGGECVGLRGVGMDVTDEKAAEETLARTERRMSLAVQLSDMEVYELDFESETLVREVPAVSVFDEAPAEEDFWPDLALLADRRDRRRVRAEWARTVAGEAPFRSEFRVRRQDGRQIWTYCVAELVRDPSGRPLRLVAAMRDVTSRKRRELQKRHTMAQMREHEERQELLLGELNHRVKNTLTAVQSVAVQTLTDNRDLPAARELFVERLLALSSTHNLLVKHAWQGASFHELVELTMKPYGRPYDCEGPDLSFDANFAVSIGMALHELATNALKHGAWQGDGRVDISVQAHDGQVRIVWRETGGPPVVAPERRGFGSRLLQRGVAAELGGTVEMDFAPTGLICTIEAPISPRLQVVEAG
jgi:two-component sensor histidine kinase